MEISKKELDQIISGAIYDFAVHMGSGNKKFVQEANEFLRYSNVSNEGARVLDWDKGYIEEQNEEPCEEIDEDSYYGIVDNNGMMAADYKQDIETEEDLNSLRYNKDQNLGADIAEVINKHSRENESNTPDFILGEYLLDCLKAFEKCSNSREAWYGKKLHI